MKKVVIAIAITILAGSILKAEELNSMETVNPDNDESLLLSNEELNSLDFEVLAPPRDHLNNRDRDDRSGRDNRRGRDDRDRNNRRNTRPPRYLPPRYPPPRNYGYWVCSANDSGWEEHYGGHSGSGRNQYEARQRALGICLQSHGNCFISNCTTR